ncbi:hypothetical protein SANTM175S_08126 [Streptomyces antimycoticus]
MVKPVNTPMANSGINRWVSPPTAMSSRADSSATATTPYRYTGRSARSPNRWGSRSSRASRASISVPGGRAGARRKNSSLFNFTGVSAGFHPS